MSKETEKTSKIENGEEPQEYTHEDFLKGASNNIKERDLTFIKREEYFLFIDLSLDCLEMGLQDDIFVNAILDRYAKDRIDDYFTKNKYTQIGFQPLYNSFYSFAGYVFFDYGEMMRDNGRSIVLQQVIKDIGMHPNRMSPEELSKFAIKVKNAHEKYRIENNLYDIYPYIRAEKHDDSFFEFLTDKKAFEDLFNEAKKEMEKNQEYGYNEILEFKQGYFKNRLEKIYPLVSKDFGLTSSWYLIIKNYVERLNELIPENQSTEKLSQVRILFLLKTLCDHLDIDTKHESFYRLMTRITGGGYDAIMGSLVDSKMGCKSDNAYIKNCISVIENIGGLKIREKHPTNKDDTPQDNLLPIIKKLMGILTENYDKLDNTSTKEKVANLKIKYK